MLDKGPIFFIALNIVRLVSIVAIIMSFAGEMIMIQRDVNMYHAYNKGSLAVSKSDATPAVASTTNSSLYTGTSGDDPQTIVIPLNDSDVLLSERRMARQVRAVHFSERALRTISSLEAIPFVILNGTGVHFSEGNRIHKREPVSSTTSKSKATKTQTSSPTVSTLETTSKIPSVRSPSSSSAKRSATATSSAATPSDATATPKIETNESYVPYSSVPQETTGVLFASLGRVLNCTVLLLCLMSELSLPLKFMHTFWTSFFPPFGDSFGVGALGGVETYLGVCMLGKISSGLPHFASWFLFCTGLLHLLLAPFGTRVKSTRRVVFSSRTERL